MSVILNQYQSRTCVEAGVKKNPENKPQNKAITDQKLHVSDLLPLAAVPWVKGHPSTMWLDQGASRPRFSVF